jgi:DNA-binding MarR family transcriptional regulator
MAGQAREPEAAADPPLFRLLNEIGIIEQLARSRFERLQPDGLPLSQFTVLNHFVRLGGERNLVALARAFQVTKASMTNTVQKLAARGWVRLRPDPADGRAKLVSLTPAGRLARQRAIARLEGFLAELGQAFPDREVADALPFLTRLRQHLDATR